MPPRPSSGRIEDQILITIFGEECGRLISDFSCAYEKGFLKQGRMYVTTRFLCFYSNLFGFEEKLRIPYTRITSVKKEYTALVIDNAIYVTTSDGSEYRFRTFWDRDQTFFILDRCWRLNTRLGSELSLLHLRQFRIHDVERLRSSSRERRESESSATQTSPTSRRRSESHPTRPGFTVSVSAAAEGSIGPSCTEDASPNATVGLKRVRSAEQLDLSSGNHNRSHNQKQYREQDAMDGENGATRALAARAAPTVPTSTASPEVADPSSSSASIGEDCSSPRGGRRRHSSVDEGVLWEAGREAFEKDLAAAVMGVAVVERQQLPMTSGDFFANFLADCAPFGWPVYQTLMLEGSVLPGCWEREQAGRDPDDAAAGKMTLVREISFVKPINVLGIESTRAVKRQRLRIYPGLGMLLSSVTLLDRDSLVPAANCFGVHDSLLIREVPGPVPGSSGGGEDEDHNNQHNNSGNNSGIEVSVYFEARFTQSTVLRYFVEHQTNRETLLYLSSYVQYIRTHRVDLLTEDEEGRKQHILRRNSSSVGAVSTDLTAAGEFAAHGGGAGVLLSRSKVLEKAKALLRRSGSGLIAGSAVALAIVYYVLLATTNSMANSPPPSNNCFQ